MMNNKSYCDRCKQIDQVVGQIWNLSLTGINCIYATEEQEGPMKKITEPVHKKMMRRLCGEGFSLCQECFFEFLDFNAPKEPEAILSTT